MSDKQSISNRINRAMIEYKSIPPEALGALMAMCVAVVRVIYDDKEHGFLRVILEAFICGALSLTFSYAIIAMGLNANWSVFVGGMVGYLGSSTVRLIALRFINSRFGRKY